VSKPVNVLIMGKLGAASIADVAKAGAARISLGSAPGYAAYGALVEIGEAIGRDGDFKGLSAHAGGARRIRSWLSTH
jgi:2-methylisocitrate lyase-like PEP mutase family enzyme